MTPEQERAEARKALEAATEFDWKYIGEFNGLEEPYYAVVLNGIRETFYSFEVANFVANSSTWLRNSLDREEQLIRELVHADALSENWRREAFRKYPTPEAYDAACAALHEHRKRADQALSIVEQLTAEIENARSLRDFAVKKSVELSFEIGRLKEEIKRLKEAQG